MSDFKTDVDAATKSANILLVEDHSLIRQSLIELIHRHTAHRVIGDTGCGREAVSLAAALSPALIVMDFHLGNGMEGLELIKSLGAACPESRILILSADSTGECMEGAARCGAHGLVSKSAPPQALFSAMEQVLQGKEPIERSQPNAGPISSLSDRERAVLRLVASGYAVREIAAHLGISRKTVEAHRNNIRTKLNVGTSDDLRRFAREYFGSPTL